MMFNKNHDMKKIVITLIIAITFIVGGMVYLSLRPKISSAQTTGVDNPVEPSSSLPDYASSASEWFGSIPTGTTLNLGTRQGTVTVNNFYASDPPVDTDGYMIIKITENYYIDYDPINSNFWIGIIGMPFSAWQTIAEQDLLATLGVSQGDACKLTVTEGVIYNPSNPLDGQSVPLSFCR